MKYPVLPDEYDRIVALSEFNLDYSELSFILEDLTRLAAKIAGTEISLVNLIDSNTQWTIANYGMPVDQMSREDSVCTYTIANPEQFEIKKLSEDDRFKNKFYVRKEPFINYYFGVPLATPTGFNIGALCVLDKQSKKLSEETIELLKIIATEVVNKLLLYKKHQELLQEISRLRQSQIKLAHDIRGPLSGITGLASLIETKIELNEPEKITEFSRMIIDAGNSLIKMMTSMLNAPETEQQNESAYETFSLQNFKTLLEKLYLPQAINKNIHLEVNLISIDLPVQIPRNKVLQIAGNLITNAIKFTATEGWVIVQLAILISEKGNSFKIIVADNGKGLDENSIRDILNNSKDTTEGTNEEQGFGLGLKLVKHLVDSLQGDMQIQSTINHGSTFTIQIPLEKI